jgi:glycosyltransferase involved in cell wall biosynthesis
MTSKVTVITVCYNAETGIEKTIQSVIGQTYQNIEYIIIDGGSKDHTLNIVNKYKDRISKVISEPDKGIYDAMNKGILAATGDWINFMNVGDSFFSPDTLSKVFEKSDHSNAGVVWGLVKLSNMEKPLRYTPFYQNPNPMGSMGICHQSIFIRSSFAKENLFDYQKYKIAADYDMIFKAYNKGLNFEEEPLVIARYDMSNQSFSRNMLMRQLRETRLIRNVNKYSFAYLRELSKCVLILIYRFFKEIVK